MTAPRSSPRKREGLPRRALLAAPALALPGTAWAQAPATPPGDSLALMGQDGWLFPLWDGLTQVDEVALRQVLAVQTEAIAILKRGNIELAYCLIPVKARTYRRFLPAGQRLSAAVDRRYGAVVAALRAAGALVPDLAQVMGDASASDPHWPVFFKTDTHWTPVGAEISAVALATLLRERLRLPAPPQPGVRLGAIRMMRLAIGDLVQYVPAEQRAAFGAEESPIRNVLASGGATALLDEDASDVQVVGTSNVQPRFNFVPVLSNQFGRAVGLSWKTNNIGPYSALLDYVRGNDFRQRRPRVIVWNHLEGNMSTPINNPNWRQSGLTNESFLAGLRRAVLA
jgi:alginate O-acetyltransferase complex protein AlgJ